VIRAAGLVAFGCALWFAPALGAQQDSAGRADSTRLATITYITGASVYVGAGRLDGLREGMSMEVTRAGVVVGTLRVLFLASRSSSSEIVASVNVPVVGDTVRYTPVVESPAERRADSAGTPARRASSPSWRRPIRGHLGFRYLRVEHIGAGGPGITQPAADLRVDGTHIGGAPFGFVVDARSRRAAGTRDTASSARRDRTRVYEASLSYSHEGSGTRISAGRQYSAPLSPVSLFDGLTVEVNRPRWSIGVFNGFQPDQVSMGFSSDIREAGGYLQAHSKPGETLLWSLTTGGIGSRELGELNREFAFAQLVANARFVSVYATQELDFNRGWKRDAGESAVSPTSSFATMQIRFAQRFAVQGGFDNRRNVRLYRDFVNPETEFDDAFRQGMWGGANLSFLRRLRISGDVRSSRGGVAGVAEQYTGSFGMDPVTRIGLTTRIRSTRYRTERTSGWLHAWGVGAEPLRFARLELNGGLRSQQAVGTPAPTSVVPVLSLPDARWIGATIDVSIGRSWYALMSITHDGAGTDRTRQLYTSLVFRF
jgi:hypothetical protein